MSPRPIMFTIKQVAEREGMTPWAVRRACRDSAIFPAQRVGAGWVISTNYVVDRVAIGGSAPGADEVQSRRGRPPGSRNRKPYPVGVKRPRKPKT